MKLVTDITELTKPCKEWIFTIPSLDEEFAKKLVNSMYEYKGFGLAANQIGVRSRVFAMVGPDHDFVCFNPKIESYSEEVIEMEEGCLSFPNLILNVKRARHVEISFADYNGDRTTRVFTGMTSRIIQHEMEHLDGELFFQGMSRYKIEKAIKEAKKLGTDYSKMGLLRYAKKEKENV